MKTLIIALNSKYIHSALAPWYLKAACGPECGEVDVMERTINETQDAILAAIYMRKPDIAAFSCYIWNITPVLKLAANLKKILPQTVIILGGPEVSHDAGDILAEHSCIDYVLAGEGEGSFPELIRQIGANFVQKGSHQEQWTPGIEGLAYRSGSRIAVNEPAVVEVLDRIPSPYTDEMLMSLKNKIVYFEASRGCPFSCSYCLSSVMEGTRYFSLERVLRELDKLVASGVRQIKFVDRTFNAHRKRAGEIVRHILELKKQSTFQCNFHFEVGADLLDEELLQLLESAPDGLFQLEAGVQSTNGEALKAVCRKTDLDRLLGNLIRLGKKGNIHIHADLIAGLPYEDYRSFGESFNRLYHAGPHQLQLGFLKFLKGTALRQNTEHYGYQFTEEPPYEILSGKWIRYDELIVLKGIAELVERYYNSARFVFSLEYLITGFFDSPFQFFERFYEYHQRNGLLEVHAGVREFYAIVDRFASSCLDEDARTALLELLRLDFLASDSSGTLPDFMERRSSREFTDQSFEFLKDTQRVRRILPEAAEMTPKQLYKRVRFERFRLDMEPLAYNPSATTILMFNYMSKDPATDRFPFYRTEL